MMTRDCGRSYRPSSLACTAGLLSVFLLSVVATFTPSIALAQSVSAQPAHVRAVTAPHQPLPWRIAPAHGILLKELNSGRVLYEHDAGKRMSPASLTKIMSALVILEKGQLDDLVTISPNAARAHKTHLRVKAGQVFRLEDLPEGHVDRVRERCLSCSGGACGWRRSTVRGSHECQGCGPRLG